jgi:hypothetical protein
MDHLSRHRLATDEEMTMRRTNRRTIVATAVCVPVLALAACQPGTSGSDKAGASASASASGSQSAQTRAVVEKLGQAVDKLGQTSFDFKAQADTASLSGSFDAVQKLGTLQGSLGIGTAQGLIVGPDVYVKGVGNDPNAWWHVDTTRLAPGNVLTEATDPTLNAAVLNAVKDARQTGTNQYSGTIDVDALAKQATDGATTEAQKQAKLLMGLLGKAQQATFTSSLDAQGRLTALTVTVPSPNGGQSTTVTTNYSNFGTAVTATAPPSGQVKEAPAQFYNLLAPTASLSASASPSATS